MQRKRLRTHAWRPTFAFVTHCNGESISSFAREKYFGGTVCSIVYDDESPTTSRNEIVKSKPFLFHGVSRRAVCPECMLELFVGEGSDGAHELGLGEHSLLKFGLRWGSSRFGHDVEMPLQDGNRQRSRHDAVDIQD